jgi:uncharacterized repeat protein (TIGR01451 family)
MKSTKVLTYLSLLIMLTEALSMVAYGAPRNLVAHKFRIMRHEAIKTIHFAEQAFATDSGKPNQDDPPTTFSFNAYGRDFILNLEGNGRLLANLPQQQKQRLKQALHIYKGKIAGIADSWVRINRSNNKISGAMWDGSDLYLIDNSSDVADAIDSGLTPRKSQANYPLVYRYSDAETDASCALEPQSATANNYSKLVNEVQAMALTSSAQTSRSIDVAIVTDAEFTKANSVNPHAAVIARMNIVDGIYSEQVGIHLNITEIRPLSTNGGMTSSSAGTLLTQFATYSATPGFNNPGLAHLFTGRDLEGNTVGIAYIGVLCSKSYGVGLSQTNGIGTAGALTIAHELGHNFGAPHDGDTASSCSTTPQTFIMSPVLNGSTDFSSCSLQQMATNISNAACLSDLTPVASADLRPIIAVNPINTKVASTFNYVVEVRNSGTASAQGSTAAVTIPSGLTVNSASSTLGTCTTSSATVTCKIGTLPASTSATLTLNLKAGASPVNVISAVKVTANNDSVSTNNTTNVAIKVAAISTVPQTIIFESNFNNDDGDFFYLDDMYGTNQYKYASGSRIVTNGNGQLHVLLGGRDNVAVTNGMSGAWRKKFTLSKPATVTLTFDYKVDQTAEYENTEYSDALVAIDWQWIGLNGANYLSRVTGDGNGGLSRTTGTKTVSITRQLLTTGTHTLIIGGFNNKKDASNESTSVFIDNVKLVIK